MSLENVQAFYAKLAIDEAFRTQIQGVTNQAEGFRIVKEAGYDFTPEEFEEYTNQLLESNASEGELRDLDERELADVIGGATTALTKGWPWPILIYGAPRSLWDSYLS